MYTIKRNTFETGLLFKLRGKTVAMKYYKKFTAYRRLLKLTLQLTNL